MNDKKNQVNKERKKMTKKSLEASLEIFPRNSSML